ncbi:hypothetical protein BX600DRAFT_475289 [Xylariales sp. PMI_506]|nr:hypothetical protein BX600DRAFT_475289 [Xylariales sp. PMI_506]
MGSYFTSVIGITNSFLWRGAPSSCNGVQLPERLIEVEPLPTTIGLQLAKAGRSAQLRRPAMLAYTDLAPSILRQRLVVEGYPSKPISDVAIKQYLSKLSEVTAMRSLMDPVTHKSDMYGWAGWIHWETSGTHFYAWEQPVLFFSVDIYTCKQFDPQVVVDFTREFFQATDITAKDFSSNPPTRSAAALAIAPTLKYTLSDLELEVLTSRLLTEQPPRTKDDLVLYRVEGTDETSNLARHIERQVFYERFKNTDADMRRIYGNYEAASVFFLVVDQALCRPIGTMRAIKNSSAGLPSLNDAAKYAGISADKFLKHYGLANLDTVWDIGTLAIPKEHRDRDEHHVVAMLYRGAHLRGRLDGMTHYIALVDSNLFRTFKMMGFAFYPMAGAKSFAYEGSEDTTPLCGISENFFPEVDERRRTADRKMKPIIEYFARRFINGYDVDHRLMFEHAMWPGGTSPLTKITEKARL